MKGFSIRREIVEGTRIRREDSKCVESQTGTKQIKEKRLGYNGRKKRKMVRKKSGFISTYMSTYQ